MEELSIEQKAKAYDEVRKKIALRFGSNVAKEIFSVFEESEDEKIRKTLVKYHKSTIDIDGIKGNDIIAWLEKQDKQKSVEMIQWTGKNLMDVINFTGKSSNFDKWFNSFDEYENYVRNCNNIFKLFNDDGSHYEVPVGAWIIRTPDGYNVASRSQFIPKSIWSEEDEQHINSLLERLDGLCRNEFKLTRFAISEDEDWLKSLKDRIQPQNTWVPSEEQLRVLHDAAIYIDNSMFPYYKKGFLMKLYKDLKKLKE